MSLPLVRRRFRTLALLSGMALASGVWPQMAEAAKPSAVDALEYRPLQPEIDYDRPTAKEIADCVVDVETVGGITGYVVRSSGGQVLRRYLDTNGDNSVDQWCYFKNGVEVYRDIDSNFNKSADQHRWLGTAGTRWAVDKNEDKQIDRWKMISPEEVSAEIVAAIRDADTARFNRLLISEEEFEALGLGADKMAELKAKMLAASSKFAALAKRQKIVTPKTEWLNFGASQPGLIPAGTDGCTKDITVYDNVTAVVETVAGSQKSHGQVVIGSLIKVGDAWRIFDLPQSLADDATASTSGGYFFQVAATRTVDAGTAPGAVNLSPESQKLIDQLNKLDAKFSNISAPAEMVKIQLEKADLLEQLVGTLKDSEDRILWYKQFADALSQAWQAGASSTAGKRLDKLDLQIAKLPESRELVPYVKFRKMQAAYNLSLQQKDADYEKINTNWLNDLEGFVKDYPSNSEAPEALFQLAFGCEFAQQDEAAAKWWGRLGKDFPESSQAAKALGAQRRLGLEGKPLALKGSLTDGKAFNISSLQGQAVLVHYWSTEHEASIKDLEILKQIEAKYAKSGLALVGVNLDKKPDMKRYLTAKPLSWPQLYAEGGLESSPLANEMGIHSLPMMILVGKDGKVVRRNIYAGELDSELKRLLR